MTHIVVLGAGYTGMIAALGIARRTPADVQVTVVNPSDRFTERLRLHQVAAGQQLKVFKIKDLLSRTRIKFLQGKATRIDAQARTVTVNGAEISFDRLVHAIGSTPDLSVVPGAAEHAYTLDNPELPALLAGSKGTFVVCGAGLTGVEAATEIAESYPGIRVILVSRGEPAPQMTAKARAHVLAPEVSADTNGRIITDAHLRSLSHPSIYAIGDAAAVTQPYGVMHGTCQGGIPTAAHAAEMVARDLAGKALRPFRFGYFHQPVSLGRRDAVIQFTNADDTPRRWFLKGQIAVRYKETVSSSPIPSFGLVRRFAVPAAMFTMSKGPR